MTLEKFTERKSPVTGNPYPRCQFVTGSEQCNKTTYGDGLCWSHYRKDAPAIHLDATNHKSNRQRKGKV